MPLPPHHRWDDVPAPRAAVHIIHGMGEHSGRYAGLAARLNAAGIAAWGHDHRGHGLNPTPPVGLGHFADVDGWRKVLEDAWMVSEAMIGALPGVPIVLFAHSMGSFAAQRLMADHGDAYAGAILSGTNGPPGIQEGVLRTITRVLRPALGGRARATAINRVVFGLYNRRFSPARTPYDWLTRDETEIEAFAGDPLCGAPLTMQSWMDFLDGRAALGRPAILDRIPKALPVHIIEGTRDGVGEDVRGVERLLRTYARAGLTRVTCTLYDDARHDLVHEINRDEVMRDVIAWIDTVVA